MSLTRHQAAARFAAVVLIELFALGICLMPLLATGDGWRKDCLWLGLATTVLALVFVAFVSLFAFGYPKGKDRGETDKALARVFEVGIVALFLLNLASLSFVISRSGGIHSSLYAPLIPIQLSVMLFLEVQREEWSKRRPIVAGAYTLIAMAALAVVHLAKEALEDWVNFSADLGGQTSAADNPAWHIFLITGGMFLTYLTYWLPRQEVVQRKLKEWYP